jgi:prophage maintenance system killer protein
LGLLQTAVSHPQAVSDIHSKAASFLKSLINNHPFVDENKPTGVTAAELSFEQTVIT